MKANRQRIVAGNWKMNKTYEEGRALVKDIVGQLQPSETTVVLCPPFLQLNGISGQIKDMRNLKLGAQNCHQETSGAYTGEISASMLRSVGADFVILGHSERREYFAETDALIAKKVDAALKEGLRPIYCCGEKLDVRESDGHLDLVATQIKTALFHLSAAEFSKVVIAYEPVWAIGTGKTATSQQAQEMHAHISSLIAAQNDQEVAEFTTILYGGSCNPSNAAELFSQADVDGGLIGGASLKAADFVAIVNSF